MLNGDLSGICLMQCIMYREYGNSRAKVLLSLFAIDSQSHSGESNADRPDASHEAGTRVRTDSLPSAEQVGRCSGHG